MKIFRCGNCHQTLYFENDVCSNCGLRQGYCPERNAMLALEPQGDAFRIHAEPEVTLAYCANAAHGACNWLVAHQPGSSSLCLACRHNEVIPPLDDPANLARWQEIERAKKRLFYSLLRLGLNLATRQDDPDHGLAFRFLAEGDGLAEPVLTGHDSGTITLAIAEADDAERARRRTSLNEPYRTLLGHFRHEIGHHYWDLLVDDTDGSKAGFRALFGDESEDYAAALQRYYDRGAPGDWPQSYISAYASAHPWEDFAETWAHLLHMMDTLETAAAFGTSIAPRTDGTGVLTTTIDFDPYRATDIAELVTAWVPLTVLLNNLNRAVGQADAYPFVLTPRVIEKLGFVLGLVSGATAPSH